MPPEKGNIMSQLFGGAELPIPCPRCGHHTKKSIGWIKTHHEYTCRCGGLVTFKADKLIKPLEEAPIKAAEALREALKKFNK
jgi:hypothetical protein